MFTRWLGSVMWPLRALTLTKAAVFEEKYLEKQIYDKEENIDSFEWKERVVGFGTEIGLRQWPGQLTFQSVEIQGN